jgi:diadenosine tetraphosphate (Ap4A) HIT family hydrolase
MEQSHTTVDCPFCAILRGDAPGEVYARDNNHGFALIQSIHPESEVHWLAVPLEHVASTEELEMMNRDRFLELVEFAVKQARALSDQHPRLEAGFTVKMHFGAFETVPHAKLHVLAVE